MVDWESGRPERGISRCHSESTLATGRKPDARLFSAFLEELWKHVGGELATNVSCDDHPLRYFAFMLTYRARGNARLPEHASHCVARRMGWTAGVSVVEHRE